MFSGAADLPQHVMRDILLDTLAQLAFVVTAQHEHVGVIGEYLETPTHGGIRVIPGAVRVDKQALLCGAALMAMTSLRTPPLLSNFAPFWRTDTERSSWLQLQSDLQGLVKTIDTRNTTREYKFKNCNPRVLECPVSV